MNITQYNGYWMASDQYLPVGEKRDSNALLIYDYLSNLGWTAQAIAGILGNMDVESSMNPALIEGRGYHTLPDNNTVLAITTQTGVGLVQWTGTTPTPPAGQKLASFAIRYNKNWYDGELQCFRLEREKDENLQFEQRTIDGTTWNWNTYTSSTEPPDYLAAIWQTCYERGGTDTQTRKEKAKYYYRLINQIPLIFLLGYRKRKELKPRCLRM